MPSFYFRFFKRLLLTCVIVSAILLLSAGIRSPKGREILDEHLKAGEKTAVIVGRNSVSVVAASNGRSGGARFRSAVLRGRKPEPSGVSKQASIRTDGVRGIRISVDDTGSVAVNVWRRGFIFEPGIGWYCRTGGGTRLFFDTQIAFAGRHGLGVGLGGDVERPRHLAAHLEYLYTFWSNTSLLVGFDTTKDVIFGIRLKF